MKYSTYKQLSYCCVFLTTELLICLYHSHYYMLHFCPVSFIFSYTNPWVFTRIHNFSYMKASLWLRSRRPSLTGTHTWPSTALFSFGKMSFWWVQSFKALSWSWGWKKMAHQLNQPHSQWGDRCWKSGPILENSLILHKVFVFCLASMGRKIPPTFCHLWCNLVKLLRFGLMQTQLHNLMLIQM